jgi:ankyrin repeat protein
MNLIEMLKLNSFVAITLLLKQDGWTPAMLASESGHTEALALLLANGANVNAAMHVIQNLYARAMNLTELHLKIYPLVLLALLLNLEWTDFRYACFTKWAH